MILCCSCAQADSTRQLLPLPTIPGPIRGATASDPNHFTFVVAGDNRSTGRDIPAPPTARQIFLELRTLAPAFSLWTGDTIYGSDDTVGEAEAEVLKKKIESVDPQYYAVMDIFKNLATGNVKLVPDVSMSGASGGSGPLDLLLGMALRDTISKK